MMAFSASNEWQSKNGAVHPYWEAEACWAYIDGKMEESDILLFEKKMASDSQLRKEYEELVQLNSLLSNQFQWSSP